MASKYAKVKILSEEGFHRKADRGKEPSATCGEG